MITNGFTYIAVLVFIAALLVWLQRYTKSKFFDYAPPIVLLYLITMILCTLGAWDMEATKPAYSVLKNNLLYAMIFLMLLRCDIRKIIKLGPKMLGGFFAASVSISVAFIATFAIMKGPLGSEAWKALGALCGSWMGGSGNMVAVQAALDIGEADMAYALVVDSIDYSIWVMFLLWAINLAPKFNKWVKADTTTLDEVSRRLEEDAKGNEDKASFVNLIFLLGLALVISAFGQDICAALNSAMPFLDKATWTVLLITLSGLIGAVTPVGRMAGSTELSHLLLSSVVAASTVYLALVAVSGLATLVVWASVSVCHLRFRHQWLAQGHTVGELKYRAPGYPFVPIVAIVMCVGALVLVICDPSQRSTLLTMIPFVALCYTGYYASVAWRAKRHGGQDDAQNALQSVPQDVSQPHREDGQED